MARGVLGLFPAHGKDDDVECYTDESRSTVQATLFGLREQCLREGEQTFSAYGDFVAPKASGVKVRLVVCGAAAAR